MNNENKKSVFVTMRESLTTRAAKIGGYSFFISLILIAVLVAVNVLGKSLPSRLTEYDISAVQLYSVSSNTKAVAHKLDKDITIYWMVQDGEEDTIITRLLSIYEGLSDHIEVVKKNPDVYPTFASKYYDGTVTNNSLIVESDNRYRYIPYSDLYEYDTSGYYYSQSVSVTGFDGEAQITSAIDYVNIDELPLIGILTGHSEQSISGTTFADNISVANYETEEFSFLTTDGATAAETYDMVLIYAPASDFSEEEVNIVRDYLAAGGSLFVLSGTQEEGELTNFKTLLNDYGLAATEGIIFESDANYYYSSSYQRMPYILIPDILDSDITTEIVNSKNHIIVALAEPLTASGSAASTVTCTPLLQTSSTAYNKAEGYSVEDYTQVDTDEVGPFTIAYAISDMVSDAKIVWVGSDILIEDSYISASSGANSDFALNSIFFLTDEEDAISIQVKSLEATTLSITASEATWIKVVTLGIVPFCYMLYGVLELVTRRRKK